jgi:hypothetical protein
MGPKCGLSTDEYPVFAGFIIFVNGCGGGYIRKMRFLHNADQDVVTRVKKKFWGIKKASCEALSV